MLINKGAYTVLVCDVWDEILYLQLVIFINISNVIAI